MHRLLAATIVLLLVPVMVIAGPAAPARAAVLPSGFSEQVVFSGLVSPTNVEFAANGQVFVAEKSGIIKVFDSLGDVSARESKTLMMPLFSDQGPQLLGPRAARPSAASRLPHRPTGVCALRL